MYYRFMLKLPALLFVLMACGIYMPAVAQTIPDGGDWNTFIVNVKGEQVKSVTSPPIKRKRKKKFLT